jgi:hypothetical protein
MLTHQAVIQNRTVVSSVNTERVSNKQRNWAVLCLRIYRPIFVIVKFNTLYKVPLRDVCFCYECRNHISKAQNTGNVGYIAKCWQVEMNQVATYLHQLKKKQIHVHYIAFFLLTVFVTDLSSFYFSQSSHFCLTLPYIWSESFLSLLILRDVK